ncbi:unnamed protein product [Pieris brassicae]|uniref:Uncharacterized protein n=1 Tax=Pieris brassicae TaxID=7116 RepID=A0A9P0TGJ6_PIEBR|nr:unnamed protein product [Pieris brassicae]
MSTYHTNTVARKLHIITSYNQVFITQFNLSFGYPKRDTCATCDAGHPNEECKSNYYSAVEAMQGDRRKLTRDGDIVYVTMDLQQTMPLPKLMIAFDFTCVNCGFTTWLFMFVM